MLPDFCLKERMKLFCFSFQLNRLEVGLQRPPFYVSFICIYSYKRGGVTDAMDLVFIIVSQAELCVLGLFFVWSWED